MRGKQWVRKLTQPSFQDACNIVDISRPFRGVEVNRLEILKIFSWDSALVLNIVPLSKRCLRFATLLVVPLIRYIPMEQMPYFSIASQHLCMIGGTSTLSRVICSARSTQNVGLPLSCMVLSRCPLFVPLGLLP